MAKVSDKNPGKGLAALFGDDLTDILEENPGKSAYRLLPLHKVEPNPHQPRRDFDPEELQALEKVHHTLLEETEESIKQTMITYRLKDGRTIHRVYSYDSASESSKQLRPLLSRLDLFEDPQILNRVVSITYENDLGDLLSDVQILSRPLTNEAFDPAVTFKHASQDLLTLDPVATGLWDAVWKDCLEGNMAQNWEYHSQSRGWLYVVYLNEDGEKKVAQFSIFKEATHTIAYLKALNP